VRQEPTTLMNKKPVRLDSGDKEIVRVGRRGRKDRKFLQEQEPGNAVPLGGAGGGGASGGGGVFGFVGGCGL